MFLFSGGTISFSEETTIPSIKTCPLFGFSNPAINLNKVLLPHPEGPSIAILSDFSISRLIF